MTTGQFSGSDNFVVLTDGKAGNILFDGAVKKLDFLWQISDMIANIIPTPVKNVCIIQAGDTTCRFSRTYEQSGKR